MDGQYTVADNDGRGRANYYAHKQPSLWGGQTPSGQVGLPLCAEVGANIYVKRSRPYETALNFWGRRALRAPGDDSRVYVPAPMDGVWFAGQHVPLMRGTPIEAQYH